MSTTVAPASVAALRAARRATSVAFIGSGFAFASWASRIPQVRDHLGLTPSALGLVLLAIALGSIVALPLSGPLIAHVGSRRTVITMSLLLGAAMVVTAIGYQVGLVLLVPGLAVMGFANGLWDVAMNVQGGIVEQQLGRSIMSRFHAGFSLGTVLGALIGVAMVAARVPVTLHLCVIAAVVSLTVSSVARAFVPDPAHAETASADPEAMPAAAASGARRALAAWREPRTLVIGLFVLAFTFGEGAGNDWIGVAVIDGYHAPAAIGTLLFAVFLTAMTAARWYGTAVLDRYGRVLVTRVLAVVAVIGLLAFVFGHVTPVAALGALLWGMGISLGFPVGMSAASDDPARAAGRVGVVSSIGYCAFLGGPPLIGLLGNHLRVLHALLVVAVLLVVAFLATPAIRPLVPAAAESESNP